MSLLVSVFVLCGCAGKSLNPPSGRIGEFPASQSKIVLREQQLVRMRGNIDYVYPAGDYRVAYEDAVGVYYEAPSKVMMKENFLGIHLPGHPFDGGIYLERVNPHIAKVYIVTPQNEGGEIQRMIRGGRPQEPRVPLVRVQFELKKS
jgi:hypothetical protein